MLIYCKKCEAANDEDALSCVACNNPLKAGVTPETPVSDAIELASRPSYREFHVIASVIRVLATVNIAVCMVLPIVWNEFSESAVFGSPRLTVVILLSSVFSSLVMIGFANLFYCVRDIAINSYRGYS